MVDDAECSGDATDGSIIYCNRRFADFVAIRFKLAKPISLRRQTVGAEPCCTTAGPPVTENLQRADGAGASHFMSICTRARDVPMIPTQRAKHSRSCRTQAALSELRFREMIDALPAFQAIDAGRLTHFNRAAVEFSGAAEPGTDHAVRG
jgi:PAS domain-containing protein